MMPPAPKSMFGREHEKRAIIATLLNKSGSPPHVAILGAGGIGKTTLALSVLHAPEVTAYYSHRYFISCEAALSVQTLLSELADALEISPASRDAKLFQTVCHALSLSPTLLCLDNFETPWLEAQPRKPIDDLLGHLNHLANLAIIITMRGTERPLNITWSKPLLEALQPLPFNETQHILENVAHNSLDAEDEYISKLVQVVEGVPLAATLLGHLLGDGLESPESLWNRWQAESTTIIKTDGSNRLSSLDVSIQLSLDCRYMKQCPDAIELLAMLALLPDGFPDSTSLKNDLIRHFPTKFAFSDALQTLKKVALAYIDQRTQTSRIRLLPPIRHFCHAKLPVHPDLVHAITTFYAHFIISNGDVNVPSHHTIVPQEFPNLQSLLISALQSQPSEIIFKAAIRYTEWTLFGGIPSQQVISIAIKQATSADIHADCWYWDGKLAIYNNNLKDAETAFSIALKLHEEADSVLGQAYDLQSLGQLQMRQNELEKAETSFNSALKLHQQANSILGQANDLQNLGQLQMHQNKLEKAEISFNSAFELHQQAHSVFGQANDLQKLGNLQLRHDQVEKAETSFISAFKLHQQVHSVLGQANDLQNLGELQMYYENELEKAEASLNSALKLHKQAHDVLGQAHDLQSLGELAIRRDELEKAETSFNSAFKLHQQAHDVLGQAYDLQNLGKLQMRRDELGKAESSFYSALKLHQQTHDVLGQANVFQSMCQLQMHQDELDKAEISFNAAFELHQQAHDVLGQANDLQNLGKLQICQDEPAKAEITFKAALELHKQTHSVLGQANDLWNIGKLQMCRNALEQAETLFYSALELYRQGHAVLGQANVFASLGELQVYQDELEKAEISFNSALKLHTQAHSVLGQANDLQSLGEVQMCLNELERAENSFNSALELYQQAHSVLGETQVLQNIGKLRIYYQSLSQKSWKK